MLSNGFKEAPPAGSRDGGGPKMFYEAPLYSVVATSADDGLSDGAQIISDE